MSNKIDPDFDRYWKTQAIKIAVMEQLNLVEQLSLSDLFRRAKIIYIEGYKQNIHMWHDIAKDLADIDLEENTSLKKAFQEITREEESTVKIAEPEEIRLGQKKCPGCGENIPDTWNIHRYTKKGTKCGYTF